MERRHSGGGDGLTGLMKGLKLTEEEKRGVKGAWKLGEKEAG